MMPDLFTEYLRYTNNTESPAIYHRWTMVGAIGALLGRNNAIKLGHSRLFPNMYIMLLGEPGARKSSAIKLVKKLASTAGYATFAAARSSRERFLLDLEGVVEEDIHGKRSKTLDITDTQLWGDIPGLMSPKEVFIVADEFNDFVSAGSIDFYTTLGNLWDWDDESRPYEDRVKNSRSVSIYQPTVSMLAGNTQENFSRAFPPELLGHGFLTRMLLIHGEKTSKKIAFPEPPNDEDTNVIVNGLKYALSAYKKEFSVLTPAAKALLTQIYEHFIDIQDTRFTGYNTRRYTHLLKLCIICCAAMYKEVVDEEVVIYANTILAHAERLMPKALGEFGKSKTSDVANKIITVLTSAKKPYSYQELWKFVHKDLDKLPALADIMNGLQVAGKVQYIDNKGWLLKKEIISDGQFVNWGLLSKEERDML